MLPPTINYEVAGPRVRPRLHPERGARGARRRGRRRRTRSASAATTPASSFRRWDENGCATSSPAARLRPLERWATFDCYGTLIDWNARHPRRARAALRRRPQRRAARAYHELEPQVEARAARRPTARCWRGRSTGSRRRPASTCPSASATRSARSLPDWPVFPEAPGALEEARARGWQLAIALEHRPRPDRGVDERARRAVRALDRRRRDRLVQAGARPLGRVLRADGRPTASATSTSRRATSTTSCPRPSSACAPSGSTASARRASRGRPRELPDLDRPRRTRSTSSCRRRERPRAARPTTSTEVLALLPGGRRRRWGESDWTRPTCATSGTSSASSATPGSSSSTAGSRATRRSPTAARAG